MKLLKKEEPLIQILYKKRRFSKVNILLIAFFLTLFLVLILFGLSRTSLEASGSLYASENQTVFSDLTINPTGPNYFFPTAEVHVFFKNLHYNLLENVSVRMSLDNSSWIEVPLSDNNRDVVIGITSLNGFSTVVYAQTYCPHYIVVVDNQTVSAIDLFYTSSYDVYLVSILSAQSIVVIVLVSIAIFSFLLQILEFLRKIKW